MEDGIEQNISILLEIERIKQEKKIIEKKKED